MRRRYQRELKDELVRAVTKHREPLTKAASRLSVPVSTACRWVRLRNPDAKATAATQLPTFVELVPMTTRTHDASLFVRVGAAEVEVRPGFDAALLRAVVEALREEQA